MARSNVEPGAVVALVGCFAYDHRTQASRWLTGLYEIVEFEETDPSVGRCCPSWLVVPKGAGDGWEGVAVSVEDYTLWSQIDPAGFGVWLAEERRHEEVSL